MDPRASTLEQALREHGCRVTRPRQVVWDVLSSAGHHLNVQELTERVHALDAGVNVSSIYRTLALFAEIDLVRESRLGDGASTWEPAHGDAVIHLVCTRCGAVQHHQTDTIDVLRRQLTRTARFTADAIDVRVKGRCDRCAPG
ncbi:MAG: Fur family transcriptional regulator [Acidimicrobiales bacterium]